MRDIYAQLTRSGDEQPLQSCTVPQEGQLIRWQCHRLPKATRQTKRTFYGQADSKRLPPPTPLRSAFCDFLGVLLTLGKVSQKK